MEITTSNKEVMDLFVIMAVGMMPVSQVNPEQKENYMAQERGKRREFLHKFLNACSTAKVRTVVCQHYSSLILRRVLVDIFVRYLDYWNA